MSDIIPRLKSLGGPNKVVALASTALDPKDDTVTALYQINQARNVTEFKAALPAFGTPMQNLFVADVEGNIGFATSGRMPVRKASEVTPSRRTRARNGAATLIRHAGLNPGTLVESSQMQ